MLCGVKSSQFYILLMRWLKSWHQKITIIRLHAWLKTQSVDKNLMISLSRMHRFSQKCHQKCTSTVLGVPFYLLFLSMLKLVQIVCNFGKLGVQNAPEPKTGQSTAWIYWHMLYLQNYFVFINSLEVYQTDLIFLSMFLLCADTNTLVCPPLCPVSFYDSSNMLYLTQYLTTQWWMYHGIPIMLVYNFDDKWPYLTFEDTRLK